MNTQAIHQLLDTAYNMLDHALKTYSEMRTLEKLQEHEAETEEDKKRRRRLRALRWALVVLISYTGYRVVRLAFSKKNRKRLPPSSRYNTNNKSGMSAIAKDWNV